MNVSKVSASSEYCCDCLLEGVDVDDGIRLDHSSATKKTNRARLITAFVAVLLPFTIGLCVFRCCYSNPELNFPHSNEKRIAKKEDFMHCGTAPLCGVLALETGYGGGYYNHDEPRVHGLWPQTDPYGDSACIAPNTESDTTEIHYCYDDDADTPKHEISFENHEWEKHGVCAGVTDADAFFDLVCSLSKKPLAVMAKVREEQPSANIPLDHFVRALKSEGYPVFYTDNHYKQILLSACASENGDWKLADVSEFSSVCGDGSNSIVPLSE
eukprot:jgi/Psemu1/285261/fgenesh1_pg.79_\